MPASVIQNFSKAVSTGRRPSVWFGLKLGTGDFGPEWVSPVRVEANPFGVLSKPYTIYAMVKGQRDPEANRLPTPSRPKWRVVRPTRRADSPLRTQDRKKSYMTIHIETEDGTRDSEECERLEFFEDVAVGWVGVIDSREVFRVAVENIVSIEN